jgi:hypothetical protein
MVEDIRVDIGIPENRRWHPPADKPRKPREEKLKEPTEKRVEERVGARDRDYWRGRAEKHGPVKIHAGMEEMAEVLKRWGVPVEDA